MDGVGWHFRRMSRGEINSNPMERELFSSESISERLVREVIQNSLDAGLRRRQGNNAQGPVRVRFSLRGVRQPLETERANFYLPGLFPHLAGGLEDDDDFRRHIADGGGVGGGMQYLVIEDAGTAGLEGDWRQFDDSAAQSAEDNYFYWFFRNVGRSGKSSLDGGSWGLGKWVFPDASRASAFIAVTRRHSDGETLLMGQTVLTKHTVGDDRYPPYGYFGLEEDGLIVPLRMSEPDHRPIIEKCIDDFGLALRDEPGLSVIVPFPRTESAPDISGDRIAAEVVHNYFYPIIAGELEVIVDEGNGLPPTEITTDTIDEVLHGLPLESSGERSMSSYQRLFDICRDAATLPERDYIELSSPPKNAPDYVHFEAITGLQGRYRAGDLLAFRINTAVRRKEEGATETPTSFRVFLQHDVSLKPGHDFHVRGWLSISEMDDIRKYSARALLVVEQQEPLAALLRDSEPPAHTAWRPRAERVRKRWTSAEKRINEARYAARELLAMWEAAPVPIERDALADIFPDDVPGERPRPREAAGPRKGGPTRVGPIESHSDFIIQPSGLGFRVQLSPESTAHPTRVSLRVAYETPHGNPVRNYNPSDFALHGDGALEVEHAGCRVTREQRGTNWSSILMIRDSSRLRYTGLIRIAMSMRTSMP